MYFVCDFKLFWDHFKNAGALILRDIHSVPHLANLVLQYVYCMSKVVAICFSLVTNHNILLYSSITL